jgi:hypothetical protein
MGIGNLYHSGFISSIHKDSLSPWYSTLSNNEEIFFTDISEDNKQRNVNALTIFSESTPLYIRILPSEYCVYIEPNSFLEYNFESIKGIQVMGNSGQKLRWYGQFY